MTVTVFVRDLLGAKMTEIKRMTGVRIGAVALDPFVNFEPEDETATENAVWLVTEKINGDPWLVTVRNNEVIGINRP